MSSGLLRLLHEKSAELGFDALGVASATEVPSYPNFQNWLRDDMHGEMGYLARDPERRQSPEALAPGTQSVIVLAQNYRTFEPMAKTPPLHGRVARYAWNRDYHDVLAQDLRQLAAFLEREGGTTRAYTDTGAILERDIAHRAGIGFVAKNTMSIRRGLGSYFFLSEILTTLELPPSKSETSACGSCRICIDACPTGAIQEGNKIDGRLCIAYLTIELKGPIPRHLRPHVGDWLFGCDICQDVCPWNANPRTTPRKEFAPSGPDAMAPHLPTLLSLDDTQFRARFAGSPLLRPKRRGLLRNACVVLGNGKSPEAMPSLLFAFEDKEPLVRGHAAWALGQIGAGGDSNDRKRIARALETHTDTDAWVAEECVLALRELE